MNLSKRPSFVYLSYIRLHESKKKSYWHIDTDRDLAGYADYPCLGLDTVIIRAVAQDSSTVKDDVRVSDVNRVQYNNKKLLTIFL